MTIAQSSITCLLTPQHFDPHCHMPATVLPPTGSCLDRGRSIWSLICENIWRLYEAFSDKHDLGGDTTSMWDEHSDSSHSWYHFIHIPMSVGITNGCVPKSHISPTRYGYNDMMKDLKGYDFTHSPRSLTPHDISTYISQGILFWNDIFVSVIFTCHLVSWASGGGGGATHIPPHVLNIGISYSHYRADEMIISTQQINSKNLQW